MTAILCDSQNVLIKHQLAFKSSLSNPECQKEAGKNLVHQFDEWWSLINGDDIDQIANLLTEGMPNLQLPVLTCWHTIIC